MKDWNSRSKSEQIEGIRDCIGGMPRGEWYVVRSTIHGFSRRVYADKKRRENESERSDERYEESKSKVVDFLKCPSCGCDTGEWEDGEFVDDNPQEFIRGLREFQGQGAKMVTCIECGHEMGEKEFVRAWEYEHGRTPEPHSAMHPEPTAERLHRQAIDAAQMRRSSRRF